MPINAGGGARRPFWAGCGAARARIARIWPPGKAWEWRNGCDSASFEGPGRMVVKSRDRALAPRQKTNPPPLRGELNTEFSPQRREVELNSLDLGRNPAQTGDAEPLGRVVRRFLQSPAHTGRARGRSQSPQIGGFESGFVGIGDNSHATAGIAVTRRQRRSVSV